jgi:hypothetical protein
MATPASWENVTPVYGIRYPKPTAPAMYLPDSFQHTGLDVEAALKQASIPPVTPAPVMVAPTAAARDAYWGVPATDSERTALQNRGATTIRTDKGWTERYFAAASAPVPGWYPVDRGPIVHAENTAAQTINNAWASLSTSLPTADTARSIGYTPAAATIQVAGLYRVGVGVRFTLTPGTSAVQVTRNSSAPDTNVIAYDLRSATSSASPSDRKIVRCAVGDLFRAFAYANLSAPVMLSWFDIEWVGP